MEKIIVLYYYHLLPNNCFEKLQYAIFPQLHTLKFMRGFPEDEELTKFLENNGRSLEKLYFEDSYLNDSLNFLNLAIAKFCPNLKSLYTAIIRDCCKILT